MYKHIALLLLLLPFCGKAQTACDFNYLDAELPKLYKGIVLKTNTTPKIFTFCADGNHYLFNASMFQQFNKGQGINRALEKDLLSFYLNKYSANSFSKTYLRANGQKIELISTIINRKPPKALEISEEVFIDEGHATRVQYSNMIRTDVPQSEYLDYFKTVDLTAEQITVIEKFEPFIGVQALTK